jgi:tungstate transport system substrate-binding protein
LRPLRAGARRRCGLLRSAAFALLLSILAGACAGSGELVLASTTSTEDSGLFDVLIPAFEEAHPGITVKVVAVGSGEALAYGRRKDADVLLVHAPLAEVQFMEAGYGELRRDVMYNDFVIVGPASNPSGLSPLMRATEGLRRIAAAGDAFVSRGDSSGTHQKELALWQEANVRPSAPWYIDVGQGMEAALRVASERQAYTLTDRSTFLALMRGLQLGIVLEGDEMLYNPYAVIVVTDADNIEAARAFATWITGPGQEVIRAFGREQFGRSLFTPNAGPPPTN